MPLLPNDRNIDFNIGNGQVTRYSPNSLWYDSAGLIHYIKIYDNNNVLQVYSLMERETDIGKRKRMLSNLIKIATVASGAHQSYKQYQNGELSGSSIVINSLVTTYKAHDNASKAKKLTDFLFGGAEKDYSMEYYNVNTGYVWHDDELTILIDSHEQKRFANISWMID